MAGLGALGASAGVMMAVGGLLQHFFGNPIKPSTFEAWGVSRHNIPTSASASGLNFEIPGKGAAGSQYNQIANVLRPVFGSGTKGRWRKAQPFFNMVAAKTKAQIDSDKEILKQAKKGDTSARSLSTSVWAGGGRNTLTDTSSVFPTAWTSNLERLFKKAQSTHLNPKAKYMAQSALQGQYTTYKNQLSSVSGSTGRNAYMTRQNMEKSISSPVAQKDLYFKILNQEIANLRGFDFGDASPNAPSQFAGYVGGQPGQPEQPEQLQSTTTSSMATGGMGRISSGSGMGAAPRTSQHGMASQA
jgi:hypothetical protein